MKKFILLLIAVGSTSFHFVSGQPASKKISLLVSAKVRVSPSQITFSWPGDKTCNNYYIYRKTKLADTWGSTYATLNASDSVWIDQNVQAGEAYEYYFQKVTGSYITGLSYLYAGINLPAVDYRGTVLLLVDESYKFSLQNEIMRLMLDLVGDGWKVKRLYISRTESVTNIREMVKSAWNGDKFITTVFLLGHIPVPYSGIFTLPPDGHDATHGGHTGAWPADVYYSELTGKWTDNQTDTTAIRTDNDNLPGDGKFDQIKLPSDPELQIGRVDLYRMPSFSVNDTFLVRRYLDKDHYFRTGLINPARRGLIDDNFASYNLAAQGWRNFAAMFGDTNIFDNVGKGKDYFPSMKTESYLWSCAAGAGSYGSCSGVGTSSNFLNDSIGTVFTMLTGSYFGDWYYPDNLLRAAIASKSPILVSFWGGIPQWHLHWMALGECIGYCAKMTQMNDQLYYNGNFNYSYRGTHIDLMGDPTLRMHVVKPPANLKVTGSITRQLRWNKSPDNITGYHVYRSNYIWGNFTRLTTSPVTDTFFNDPNPLTGANVYMVRAIKLETSASGTYFNMSQGIFDTATFSLSSDHEVSKSRDLEILVFPNPSTGLFNIRFESKSSTARFDIFDPAGKLVISDKTGYLEVKSIRNYDLSEFGKGVFLIRIMTGNDIYYRKIIIY